MQILTVVALIVIGILLFELIIFSHEFGHFITAKLSGVKVNEFALGMGPKIISFVKGETRYSLRLFPIGGYCAMEELRLQTANLVNSKSNNRLHQQSYPLFVNLCLQ